MTTHSDWPQLFDLFERLADMPVGERTRLLDDIARDQPELRARLERLLTLDASAPDLAADVAGWSDQLTADHPEPLPERLGAWRILREIGVGGMGRVLLGERADGEYEQTAALKLIRGGFTSDDAVTRFLRERRILARLDHPGIARLIDGGVDGNGRPWFAMQYVDGMLLIDYCTAHTLDLRARLHLFIDICRAVAYAHRHLVIHCDLKPSNVLVDASGHAHLLDFGIARLLGAQDTSAAGATRTLPAMFTPGYAAPEQRDGGPLGVATDVYALGAMLFELLTGERPQPQGDAPCLPSRAATAGHCIPARRLRGELDFIVSRALCTDPAQRYADADVLAEDLRRHLNGWPLLARRDNAWYRVRKFIGRHRIAAPLAAVALVALIATTALALRQTAIANERAAEATAVRDFLVDIFHGANPHEGDGTISTRTLIERGSASLDATLKAQPELTASFAAVLGNVYRELSAYDDADAMLRHALTLTTQRYGENAAQLAPILRGLAQTLIERDKLDEAHTLLERARAIDLRTQGADAPVLVEDDALAATLAQHEGKLPDAQTLISAAITRMRAINAPPERLAAALSQRAVIEYQRSVLDDAERDTREAIDLFRQRYGERSLDVVENFTNLGVLRMRRGDAAGAETYFRDGLSAYQHLLPAEHRLIAAMMINLARSLDRQGKSSEAEALYKDALTMQHHLLGDTHAEIAATLNNLGNLYATRGDYAQAHVMMQQALDVWMRLSGPTHPLARASRIYLGAIEREEGDYAQARATLQAVLDEYRKQPAGNEARQAFCLDQLGILARYEERYAQAQSLHQEAQAVYTALKQTLPVERAFGLTSLSLTETATGHASEASAHAEEAVALFENANAQAEPNYSAAVLARARAALGRGDTQAARKDAQAVLEQRMKSYGENDFRSAEAELVLGEVELAEHQRAEAEKHIRTARDIMQAKGGANLRFVREADSVLRDLNPVGK
ncbi:MAG: serine/threonine-protein kinase [Rhodanobacter sp.]|jgi:serine/threonine-protein kinase|nr:serine/threonine-protein kinase [Rhodanobacter sp.]